jgi:nucleoid DNA-binding protein/flagellar basal body-associated protein FliL
MDNKINLSQLAERLSQEGGMSKAAAEQFVKNFFDIISQRVLSEGLVKVKGLGTFKLLQMEDRESVNVNTGERFTIDGHQKISFVPDADLKERINKPFAAFETVVITEEQAAQLARMDTETENAPAQEPAAKPAKAAKAKAAAKEETQEPKVKDVTQKKGTRCLLKIILWIVITILVIGLGLFMLWPVIGNNVLEVLERNYLDRNKTEMVADSVKTAAPVQEVAPVKEAAPEKPAAQPAAKPAAQPAQKYPTIQLNSKDQAKDLSEFTMDDVNNFSMEGVLATHTLAKGETITRVALKYYGSKKLWPYIAKYNNIKDPTKLHEGTVIKVPVLKAK